MKNVILIALLLVTVSAFSQEKKSAPVENKPTYQRYIVISEESARVLSFAVQSVHRLTLYDPNLTDKQKVEQTIFLENFLKTFTMKLDSVRTDKQKVVQPPKKK